MGKIGQCKVKLEQLPVTFITEALPQQWGPMKSNNVHYTTLLQLWRFAEQISGGSGQPARNNTYKYTKLHFLMPLGVEVRQYVFVYWVCIESCSLYTCHHCWKKKTSQSLQYTIIKVLSVLSAFLRWIRQSGYQDSLNVQNVISCYQ